MTVSMEEAAVEGTEQTLAYIDMEKELHTCKHCLSESQEDVQQLQMELFTSNQTVKSLQQQLCKVQQHNQELQQQLASHSNTDAQLAATQLQLTATKQQLAEAKQALVTMQTAMLACRNSSSIEQLSGRKQLKRLLTTWPLPKSRLQQVCL